MMTECERCGNLCDGVSCACGWTATRSARALPPWRWFTCSHCRTDYAYRSSDLPVLPKLCRRCRTNTEWYNAHADLKPDPWINVGQPYTPEDDPIAEPDYFPRLIFEYAQTHGILVTEAAVLLAPDWLARHPDDPECARVRLYLENIGRAREKNA